MEVGYHVDSKIRLAHTAFKERVNCSFSSKYEVIDVTRDSSIPFRCVILSRCRVIKPKHLCIHVGTRAHVTFH